VSAGLKIKGTQGGYSGTIGALVSDAASRIYALVPRSVFGSYPESSLAYLDKSEGGHIGPACTPLLSAQRPRPLCESIGLVPISLDTQVMAACDDLQQLGMPADYGLNLLGKSAHIVRLSGISRLGSVYRMDSIIKLNKRDGTSGQAYEQTLEVKLTERNVIRAGDGGAIVLDSENAPIGMIVGATEEHAFIAPLSPLLRKKQIHFLMHHEADAHNRAAANFAGHGAEPDDVVLNESKTSHTRFADEGVLVGSIGLLEAA
jgi:hypothetical protein